MAIARRGFLGVLAGVIAGPSIVRASNLMPIKVTDISHLVKITGVDIHGNQISEYVRVLETLSQGLDLSGYNTATELIRPKFRFVSDISWTKGLMKATSIDGGCIAATRFEDVTIPLGLVYSSRTNVYQPDAPSLRETYKYDETRFGIRDTPLPY